MARRILIPEFELVSLLKNKDQRGFNILYNNYSAALYGVVNKIVNSHEDSADLLQDIFVKIWKNIEYYDESKGSIFTWMMNIARNIAIDKVRSADYRDSGLNIAIEDSQTQIDSENQIEQEVDAIGLRKLVDTLKPEYKKLIELIYFKGYTQADVSEEFGIPLGTVKTRIKAAVSQLRNLICLILILLF
ncbi:MAG: RNA polymerase sigma factor [Spirosomataceae bacterium]